MKGQKSRAGTRMQPRVREILKQYPKRRGYRRSPYAVQPAVLNVGAIEKHFESGEKVTPATLAERNLLGTIQKKPLPVKLLGNGTITKQVTVEGCMVSSAARKKIEEAGGSVV
jgi:large subunit ribosomal protein L15